jgi:hypothetical protein
MEVKKEFAEVTYSQVSTTHTFDVNGKKIRVYVHIKADSIFSDYDNEESIDEKDKETLTDDELQLLDDNLVELLELEKGETLKIEE